jgi:hypothetical protein
MRIIGAAEGVIMPTIITVHMTNTKANSIVEVARGLVLLYGNRHIGPSITGSEDEVEQSFKAALPVVVGRSKPTCELTSRCDRPSMA